MVWYEILALIGLPTLGGLIFADIYARIKVSGKKVKERHKKESREEIEKVIEKQLSPIAENLEKLNSSINILEEAVCSSLRNNLLDSYKISQEKGYRSMKDTENWEHLYCSYKNLGGNSFIDNLRKDFYHIDAENTVNAAAKPSVNANTKVE